MNLTHEQHLWINLFLIIAFILGMFAAGGYFIEHQEKKEQKMQRRYNRRRRKLRFEKQQEAVNAVYTSIGFYVFGMDKHNAICPTCEFYNDNKCYCNEELDVFRDDTYALVDCNCYCKKECEKGKKNNHSEQNSK